MTTPDQILRNLLTSDSTTDALAERMRIPMLAVRAMCDRHEIDSLVTHVHLAQDVDAWSLTPNGREVARSLTLAAYLGYSGS